MYIICRQQKVSNESAGLITASWVSLHCNMMLTFSSDRGMFQVQVVEYSFLIKSDNWKLITESVNY